MQRTRATLVTLGIANTRMHKIPEKCIESAWNASEYCARSISPSPFAAHVPARRVRALRLVQLQRKTCLVHAFELAKHHSCRISRMNNANSRKYSLARHYMSSR